MAFSKFDAARLYKKLRALEPNVSGALGTPPSGSAVGAVGDVVLVTGAGTTTDVLDARITNTTFMEIAPTDLYGSAEKGAGNIFWSSPADGIMRITHTASTKTRTFKYLLMFALALLLASASFGQVIQDDGVPLEVRPALNFTTDISCANVGDGTDCQLADAAYPGDVMLQSVWVDGIGPYGLGYPYVGFAEYAVGADTIDSNFDGIPELSCVPPFTCAFDTNENGVAGVFFNDGSLTVGESGTGSISMTSGATGGFGAPQGDARVSRGLRIGNGSNSHGTAQSVCQGRSPTADKNFEDIDCDFQGGVQLEPETTPSTTSNSETFLTDMQRRLAATFGPVVAVAGAGVQVTALKLDLDWIGAYLIEYQLLTQSTVVTTGMSFGVNFTGAFTSLFCRRELVSTGVQIPVQAGPFPIGPFGATGVTDNVAATLTGQMVEGYASNAASTVTPLLGPNDGVAVINATALETIKCNLLTTAAGDLELWMTSETGAGVNLMANSMVRATPFP